MTLIGLVWLQINFHLMRYLCVTLPHFQTCFEILLLIFWILLEWRLLHLKYSGARLTSLNKRCWIYWHKVTPAIRFSQGAWEMIRYLRVCPYRQLSSLISLALIWWQRLFVPAQRHKVWNPLTFSTFKPAFSPSVCRGIVEPDFPNPSIASPKVWFMISPGCRFSSGNIKITETGVEVFTGVTKIWSNIMVLLKENKKKKITLFTGMEWESKRKEMTRFLWGEKAETRVSAALILKTGFACSFSGGVAMHLFC